MPSMESLLLDELCQLGKLSNQLKQALNTSPRVTQNTGLLLMEMSEKLALISSQTLRHVVRQNDILVKALTGFGVKPADLWANQLTFTAASSIPNAAKTSTKGA